MPKTDYETEFDTLKQVLGLLSGVSPDARKRIIRAIATFVSSGEDVQADIDQSSWSPRKGGFTEDRTLSPKEFMLAKRPNSDVERIACLAYYLTHYRDTPEFKTKQLTDLNSEAGLPRIGNATRATDNAYGSHYLIQGTRGNKRISALGEQYIQVLPDREAAREILHAGIQTRKRRKRPAKRG